jgi:hypothetical protein
MEANLTRKQPCILLCRFPNGCTYRPAQACGRKAWVTDTLSSPALYLVRDPAHRLPGEEAVPQMRYRVTQQG